MDSEQTFVRVQERFSQMLTPKARVTLEYICLFTAVTLFCILVVMHANYVQLPGCSNELSEVVSTKAQLIEIKVMSAGFWAQTRLELPSLGIAGWTILTPRFWLGWSGCGAVVREMILGFCKAGVGGLKPQHDGSPLPGIENGHGVAGPRIEETRNSFLLFSEKAIKSGGIHFGRKWQMHCSLIWRSWRHLLQTFQRLLNLMKKQLDLDVSKLLKICRFDILYSYAVHRLEKKRRGFEPSYLYTMEKGFFLLTEEAKSQHNISTVNFTISAQNSCFGNRWQQFLINKIVGYDTIMINSLWSSPGQGYLYNFQSKEFYNLSYAQKSAGDKANFEDYLVTKCGVLMMSLFVFFTTTMSVSFTLRETQTRMLKFTAQLQHHARYNLPTFQLIFVHVIESLVFVPIMIGILFFLFEFYDDQLLAFMVLILVWSCELFTLISVRTPISMKFFPRFFLLYFLIFHIYFFSYAYGFSYLALSTTAAFMQHLIFYFWNRFEVPALEGYLQMLHSQQPHHPDFHVTSSTVLASTLHITGVVTRNSGSFGDGLGVRAGPTPDEANPEGQETEQNPNTVADMSPSSLSSFSSLLLWILGGGSNDGTNSFLSIFRDVRPDPRLVNGDALAAH